MGKGVCFVPLRGTRNDGRCNLGSRWVGGVASTDCVGLSMTVDVSLVKDGLVRLLRPALAGLAMTVQVILVGSWSNRKQVYGTVIARRGAPKQSHGPVLLPP